jgi:hypothetical protein
MWEGSVREWLFLFLGLPLHPRLPAIASPDPRRPSPRRSPLSPLCASSTFPPPPPPRLPPSRLDSPRRLLGTGPARVISLPHAETPLSRRAAPSARFPSRLLPPPWIHSLLGFAPLPAGWGVTRNSISVAMFSHGADPAHDVDASAGGAPTVPACFVWPYGGKRVFLSGSFTRFAPCFISYRCPTPTVGEIAPPHSNCLNTSFLVKNLSNKLLNGLALLSSWELHGVFSAQDKDADLRL